MKGIRKFVVFLLFSLWAFPMVAQKADAVIDRREILIGEQAVISLSVSYNKDNPPKISFPTLGDTLVDKVEVVEQTQIDTLETAEEVRETRVEQKIFITSFDSGYYAIPPFEFTIDGETQRTEAFLLTVKTVEIDTTAGIKPNSGIFEIELSWQDYVYAYWEYAAGAVALVGLITALIFLIRKYRNREKTVVVPVAEEPKRTPDEIAIDELNRIREERIFQKGKIKEYHTEITDAVRDYLESAFSIPAHELTTGQIMSRLRYSGITEKETTSLRSILYRADMVKFAKEKPDVQENLSAVEDAIIFVKSTAERIFADAEIKESEK